MTPAEMRARVAWVVEANGFSPAVTPFSFDNVPTGEIDGAFRVELQAGNSVGGFNFSEERTDSVIVWLARKYNGNAEQAYQQLLVDANTVRSAVVRDGATVSGEYFVTDDGELTVEREQGREFTVARLALPVNYEQTL